MLEGQPLKPNQILEAYVDNGRRFIPEEKEQGVTRTQLNSMIHGLMTVENTAEWDEEMHPQVDRLKVGETTVLKSGANEYMKVTKTSGDKFDVEYGAFEDID